MVGTPWCPKPATEPRPSGPRGVYITLDRQIKFGGTPGCNACHGHAKVHSPECRARFEELMAKERAEGNEAAQAPQAAAPD